MRQFVRRQGKKKKSWHEKDEPSHAEPSHAELAINLSNENNSDERWFRNI